MINTINFGYSQLEDLVSQAGKMFAVGAALRREFCLLAFELLEAALCCFEFCQLPSQEILAPERLGDIFFKLTFLDVLLIQSGEFNCQPRAVICHGQRTRGAPKCNYVI